MTMKIRLQMRLKSIHVQYLVNRLPDRHMQSLLNRTIQILQNSQRNGLPPFLPNPDFDPFSSSQKSSLTIILLSTAALFRYLKCNKLNLRSHSLLLTSPSHNILSTSFTAICRRGERQWCKGSTLRGGY